MKSTNKLNRHFPRKVLACTVAMLVSSGFSFTANADSGVIEEVLVTARKVEENLQDTPVAVTAVTAEAMDRRMITSTTDLARITPNLQFTAYSPLSGNNSAAQVFIRGIGQSDASGGVDPGVGLYIDDVYMGRSVGGVMEFRDIDNVQVLRGPQGTLFGRNTIGGAVLMSTKKPGDTFGGDAKLKIGDDGLQEIFGAIDLPMGDKVAARISFGSRERDGYVTRIYDGLDLGNEDTSSFNGSLHIKPTDSLSFVIRADHSEANENGSPFVFASINERQAFPAASSVDAGCPGATMPPPSVPVATVDIRCANNATWQLGEFTNGGNTKAESNMENQGFSLSANWDINDTFSTKYIAAKRSLEWDGSRDADNTYLTILSTQYDSEADQTSHELQLLASGDSYHGVLGYFVFDEDVNDFLRVPFAAPPAVLPPGRAVALDHQDATLNNKSDALFTQWTFNFSDAWSLSAGLRYTEEEKTIDIIAFTDAVNLPLVDDGTGVFAPLDPLPQSTIPTTVKTTPLSSAPGGLNIQPVPFSQEFDSTTGSLSLQYRINDDLMTYVSWSEGFKSGGYNQRYNAVPADGPVPLAFDSEEAVSTELGFKADITSSFRVNGALFHTTYDNMQLTYRVGIVPLLFNAGESTISGAELEFTYVPTAEFILEGNIGYMDDDIKEIATITGASATLGPQNDLPFTPNVSASLGGGYVFSFGSMTLTPRLDISYTSEQFFDASNSIEVAQTDPVTVANFSLKLAADDGEWEVAAGVRNLTDELYPVAGNSSLTTSAGYAEVIYARPRNYYLSASYKF